MEEIVFESYLKESACIFKDVIELLHQIAPIRKQSVKQVNMRITKYAININNDISSNVIINCVLNADHFCNYIYNYDFPELNIGITLDILKKLFKTAKKNEGIGIRITKSPAQLIPDEITFSRSSNFSSFGINSINQGFIIKFNIKQNININSNILGTKLIELSNDKFLHICKEMGGSKRVINVTNNAKSLIFTCNIMDIAKNWISFPLELDAKDPSGDEISEAIDEDAESYNLNEDLTFTFSFKSEYIKVISKMASLCKQITLLYDGNSLVFRGNIFKNMFIKPQHGVIDIGTMTIWIKSQDE